MNVSDLAHELVGTLYVVSTPIGNLDDFSARAIETLKRVDVIAAEDKRHSARLLSHYNIVTPMCAYHDHSDIGAQQKILNRLQKGDNVALISDAGTPLIADPGYRLIKAVREANVPVIPIPGACALIAALCVAGLPTDRFAFEGFLPAKTEQRMKTLESLARESRTLVFYEAPHRLLSALQAMQACFGDTRRAVLARELTKRFETLLDGALPVLVDRVSGDTNQQKGECVIVVEGYQQAAEQTALATEVERVLSVLLSELSLKQAVKLTVQLTGMKKNQVYDTALKIQEVRGE